LNCDGLTIDFINATINADEFIWIFDYGNPDSETSTEPNPSFTFPEAGYYDVGLLVNDFDSLCFDTIVVTVGVFDSQLNSGFVVDIPKCDMPIIIQGIDVSNDPDFDIVGWEYVLSYPGVSDTSILQFPLFSIDTVVQGVNLSLTVTASNGCTATYDTTFDANVLTIPFKGDTVGVCSGDSVYIFTAPGGNWDYTWSPTEGLLLTDPGSPSNPIAFPSTSTTYHVTITDGLCEVTDSVVVALNSVPALGFEPFTDCRSLQLEIMNTTVGGFNFVWDFGDSLTSTDNDPVHVYDSAGVYVVTLTSDDGCNVSIQQTVTVSAITNDLPDQTTNCFSEPIFLNPEGSSDYSYVWTPAEFLDDPTIPNPLADIDVTTTFYVTITDNMFPGCSVLDSVQVLVGEDFSLSGPPDSAYCKEVAINLNAGNKDLVYEWFDLDGNLLGMGPDLLVAPDSETSYILVGTDGLGCEKRDTITLSPTVIQIEASQDTVVCFGESVTIFATNQDTTQNLTYVWSPANLIDGSNTGPVVTAKPGAGNQLYIVEVTNEIGCVIQDSVYIGVSLFEIEFASSVLICKGDEIELQVGNFDTSGLTFTWTPTEFIVPGTENTASPNVFPPVTTVFMAHIVNDDYGCETDIQVTVNVSWFTPDVLVITSDFDTIILGDKVFNVFTNQDPTLDFQWSGPGVNSTDPEITISPTGEGTSTYGVTVTNQDGCELIGEISLTVLDPLCNEETVFLPDAFSPNNDGQNDELEVYSNFLESIELRIFNRWGEQVYSTTDINFKWDGTYKGKELTPDVYGYYMRVVCTPNKPYFRKGNITLFK
jgi:gliding motility-associated-like protein